MKKDRISRIGIAAAAVLLTLAAAAAFVLPRPSDFGRLPSGGRLERILASPHYKDGEFRYPEATRVLNSRRGGWRTMLRFLTRSNDGIRPPRPIVSEKVDLNAAMPGGDCIVWFGHSSYLLQLEGRRFLVDPVFRKAAPVGWINRPFPGADRWRPADLPPFDDLLITHDHWDHLDRRTVCELRDDAARVILPLGVGEHFEFWGWPAEKLVELDWNESAELPGGFRITALPARHFSGRGLRRNQTLWASFLLRTPSGRRIFLGGDGGYGPHFREIGRRFPGIDLAILENGQYNPEWAQIHTLPAELPLVCADLNPKEVITVHHSRFALSQHPWDEPRRNEDALESRGVKVLRPVMGRPEPLWQSANDINPSPEEQNP